MKRKIITYLLIFFIVSALGAALAASYIGNTTSTLSRLIILHQIGDVRQNLVMSIQTVQSELYTVHTNLGHKLDLITEHVSKLEKAAQKCSTCHHAPLIADQIEEVQSKIVDYRDALNIYITASAASPKINKLKIAAAAIGNQLLVRTEEISVKAGRKLEFMTRDAMQKVRRAWMFLLATMILTFVLGIVVAVKLATSITKPINTLVNATRMIASGDLGFMVLYRDKTELGELASHFNIMSRSLKNSYTKLEEEIGERKQTEVALKKSEAFLNTIFDSIHDPFCIIDSEYRIIRANESYALMKKKRLSELIGKTCYEALQRGKGVCDDCIVLNTFASGNPCAKEKGEFNFDGVKKWSAIFTYPIVDSDGKVSYVIEYTHDITERKRAEEALRESEERYALAARGANDGLWDWDLRHNKVHFSYRWKSMLGFGENDISNNPEEWFSRVHADDRGEVEAKVCATSAAGIRISSRVPHHAQGWYLSLGD